MIFTDDWLIQGSFHCIIGCICLYIQLLKYNSFISYTKLTKHLKDLFNMKKTIYNLCTCFRNNGIRHWATILFINIHEASLAEEQEALIVKIAFVTSLNDNINSGCRPCSCNIYVTRLTWDMFIASCFCLIDSVIISTNFICIFFWNISVSRPEMIMFPK